MDRRRYEDDDERPPEELTGWLAAHFRRVEALAWRKWNFTLAEAVKWRTVGVPDALSAAQWQAAAVSPDTVRGWLDARISAGEAVRWHEFGYDLNGAKQHAQRGESPDDALRQRTASQRLGAIGQAVSLPINQGLQQFLSSGAPHELLRGYLDEKWLDEEAIAWAKQDIPASDARLWQEIGLTSTEAGELRKAGQTPAKVIRDWWRAGIPFDEVGDWLGAGLSVEEAVTQRGSGVTVEQAAALRALRRGGAL